MCVSPCVQVVVQSMESYAVANRSEWVVAWPGQAVLCVSQKYWTALVHEAIRKGQQVPTCTHQIACTFWVHVHVHVCIIHCTCFVCVEI